MGWTVACFCGNVYTAPPDQCNVCHRGLDHAATPPSGTAAETHSLAATVVTESTSSIGSQLQSQAVIPAGR
jgi:hypothetical protein